MPNLYVDLNTMKSWLQDLDRSTEDTRILVLLSDVSRMINRWTKHHFYVQFGTRYPVTKHSHRLFLPPPMDIVSITSLKTDSAGDRTYATTWDATDYDLEPEGNQFDDDDPKPYWEILTTPMGRYSFPTHHLRSIQITGQWGYYDVRERSSATVAEALDTSETVVDVSDGTQFSIGHTLRVDSEQMYVSSVAENTLTVTRGANGTTAASHDNGAAIDVYTYPLVREAVKEQFNRWSARRDSPLGSMGSAEFGVLRLSARLDPDVQVILAPIRARAVG